MESNRYAMTEIKFKYFTAIVIVNLFGFFRF